MDILIQKNGRTLGPFSEEEVVAKFESGEFGEMDLAMVKGHTGWHELGSYLVAEPLASDGQRSSERREVLRGLIPPEARASAAREPMAKEEAAEEMPAEATAYEEKVSLDDAELSTPRPKSGVRIGFILLAAGLAVMVLSVWPWALYLPLLTGAVLVGLAVLLQGRLVIGLTLIALTVAASVGLWSTWTNRFESRLRTRSTGIAEVETSSTAKTPPAAAPATSEARVVPPAGASALAPADSPASSLADGSAPGAPSRPAAALPPDIPGLLSPEGAAAGAPGAQPPYAKGQRVALSGDAVLRFRNEPYRQGKAGEEFEVAAFSAEQRRVYLSAQDPQGKTIALNIDAEHVAPVAAPTATAIAAPGSVEAAVYLVKTDKGHGSAFLAEMEGRTYLVTNFHVLKGASRAEFVSPSDAFRVDVASELEVSVDRDLVRFQLPRKAALAVNRDPKHGDAIHVYGNAGGQRVVTRESGEILGVGPAEVEVSAPLIPGNSGGPIVDDQKRVIAVATYLMRHTDMSEWVTNNTRFAESRRFGVRLLDTITWTRTRWDVFSRETKLIVSLESFLEGSKSLALALATRPYQDRITSEVYWHQLFTRTRTRETFDGLISAYNSGHADRTRLLGKPSTSAELHRTNDRFESRIRSQATNLGRCLRDAANELGRHEAQFTIDLTRKEYRELCQQFEKFGASLDKAAKDFSDTRMFSF